MEVFYQKKVSKPFVGLEEARQQRVCFATKAQSQAVMLSLKWFVFSPFHRGKHFHHTPVLLDFVVSLLS